MNKYILVWYYHDCNVDYFDSMQELKEYLKVLIKDYKYDNDFHYEVINGNIIYNSREKESDL